MSTQQFRWLLLAIGGGLLAYVAINRRKQLVAALPEPLMQQAERIVIPWSALERKVDALMDTEADAPSDEATEAEETEETDSENPQRRKVSRRYSVRYLNKQYGPLPESLVGAYVEVEERDGELYILHNGTPVANFALQH